MNPGASYQVQKKGKGDPNSAFLSIKLSATLRSALLASPHNSFIEFTSENTGMIHVGDDTHNFSIRKDANKEVYDLCPDSPGTSATSSSSLSLISTAEVVADTPVLSYMGPVSGKVILDQKGITSQETALIRQRTEKAEKEARKRKTLALPLPPSSSTSSSPRHVRAALQPPSQSQRKRPRAELEARSKSASSASSSASAPPGPSLVRDSTSIG